MLTPSRPNDTSAVALGVARGGAAIDRKVKSFTSSLLGEVAGRAGSKEALKKLTEEISEQKRSAARPLLLRASRAFNAGDTATARELALQGLQKDEQSGFGWYILGMALEIGGDFTGSIRAYEAALKLLPNHEDLANDLGRLALRLGMHPQAEKLFRHHLAEKPGMVEVLNNLGTCLREMGRYDEAIEVIRPAIMEHPTVALLWNTMGTIMGDMGDIENALIFCREAIRLDPEFYRAHHNLANMTQLIGDSESSLEHADKALERANIPSDQVMMRMARFNALVTLGRLVEGWDEYETRLDPNFAGCTLFAINRPTWKPSDDVRGKRILVMGEQGLGDEILFGTVIPDLIEDIGPEGAILISVERRLVKFFQQAFPQATVVAHRTSMIAGRATRIPLLEPGVDFDMWMPMASLLRRYRLTYESFGDRTGVFKPDPDLLAHWRKMTEGAGPGLKVGLLWKSASTAGARHRFYSPLEQWGPVLTTPGVSFVNLQYGDCAEDLAFVKERFGVEIWNPSDVDLKQDLDDVAALSAACDLVIGFSNATLNIAAGCGVPTWLVAPVGAWPALGLPERYVWYPQARMFRPDEYGGWDKPMKEMAEALAALCAERAAA